MKHIRANRHSLDALLEKAKGLADRGRAQRFARAVWMIAEQYTRRLEAEQRIDYDDMISDAARLIEARRFASPYSVILVDEFQDISAPRARMIKALRHNKPFSKVFAVGDDWQSIYRFAGSDISIFTKFQHEFGVSWQGRLERTYRSNQLIAETAARFIQRNPNQLKKTVRSIRPAVARSIRVIPIGAERGSSDFKSACLKVLGRLDHSLTKLRAQWATSDNQKLKVLVLWRYNRLNPFGMITPNFTNISVQGLTFHRSKGLEADYTIMLDVSEGDYGVPSQIEEDELLNLVMPAMEDHEFVEERRLFYVALTRASRGVYLLCNRDKPSRFIGELRAIAGEDVRFESPAGERIAICPACLKGEMIDKGGRNGSRVSECSRGPYCQRAAASVGLTGNDGWRDTSTGVAGGDRSFGSPRGPVSWNRSGVPILPIQRK